MKLTPKALSVVVGTLFFTASAALSVAQVTLDTTNLADWKISNGVLSVDWNSNTGHVFSIHWSAFPTQELIDQTNRDHNGPKGF